MLRCPHGIYMSAVDAAISKSWGCDQCYPDGHPLDGDKSPIMPRSSADVLSRENARTNCVKCLNIRTYFSPTCRHCGTSFPEVEARSVTSQQNTRANAGACPSCRSTIHYETKKVSKWLCADCDTEYTAPAGQRRSAKIGDDDGVA